MATGRALACLIAIAAAGGAVRIEAAPDDLQVTPGEFVIEHPTLINLGFEWHIDGDANRNARVEVSFRKQGDGSWRTGLPLLRLHGEQVYWRNIFNLVVPNMFAGSILDLEPDTAYEARFVLTDPDGLRGTTADATKVVTVRTRPEPMPGPGGKVYHVYPVKWQGPKQEPAFEGIMCAYNYYCGAGDTAPGGRPRVKPGDTVLVHAGLYETERRQGPTAPPARRGGRVRAECRRLGFSCGFDFLRRQRAARPVSRGRCCGR